MNNRCKHAVFIVTIFLYNNIRFRVKSRIALICFDKNSDVFSSIIAAYEEDTQGAVHEPFAAKRYIIGTRKTYVSTEKNITMFSQIPLVLKTYFEPRACFACIGECNKNLFLRRYIYIIALHVFKSDFAFASL